MQASLLFFLTMCCSTALCGHRLPAAPSLQVPPCTHTVLATSLALETNFAFWIDTDALLQDRAPLHDAGEDERPNSEPSPPQPAADSAAEPQTGNEPASSAEPMDTLEFASEAESVESAGADVPTPTSVPAPTANRASAMRVDPAWHNLQTNILLGVVLVTLAIASLVGQYLRRRPSETVNPALVLRFRQRLNTWWLMCAILVFGLVLQPIGTVILFGLVSFWALREFITMAPTRRGDHRALFWALIVFTPLQYILIGMERGGFQQWRSGQPINFYGLYSIMIPVYASLFVPARIAISGDHKRFLERTAQITVGLLICVYALSYAPALINLKLARSDGSPWQGSPAGLLFFFILISQLTEILQWTWGQVVGKRIIAAEISTSRTWEGFIGGTLTTGLFGAGLFWVTPFSIWEAACMSMVIGVMGMFGGMTMSAIKRDRGVNDYGTLVMGHAGVLDRIDTVCFAAPVFYHLTRFFFTVSP
jgi:phosphatidate cytidylyltransferase